MPSAASVKGTNNVSVIDANASENAVHSTTRREDEPDVVRFPDRPDGVVDDGTRAFAAVGATRDEVPEAGAEVGAPEQRIRGHAEEQHDRDRVAPTQPTGTSSRVRGRWC